MSFFESIYQGFKKALSPDNPSIPVALSLRRHLPLQRDKSGFVLHP